MVKMFSHGFCLWSSRIWSQIAVLVDSEWGQGTHGLDEKLEIVKYESGVMVLCWQQLRIFSKLRQKIRKCFATSSEIVWNVRFPDIHHPLIWGINSTRITKLCQSASLEPFTHFNIYSLYFTSFLTTKQVFSHRPSATLLFSIFSWESLFDSSQCLTGQCVTRSLDDDGNLVSEYFHIYIWYKTRLRHRHGPSFRALSSYQNFYQIC